MILSAKFSIIIPVYNVEGYLDRCMNSVVNQKFTDYEVILVDDGSTDNSGKMCDAYAERYDFVSVYHKENGGLSDARNYGLDRAAGEYILFVDSDDYISEDACDTLYSSAVENNADIVIGHSIVLRKSPQMEKFENIARDNFKYNKSYTGEEYLYGCLSGGALSVEAWRSLYRKAFLIDNGLRFEKNITHEDEEFTPRVLLKAKNVVLSPISFYYYDNSRTNSIMNASSLSAKKAKDCISIYCELLELYHTIENRKLKRLLEDDISWKYIDCCCKYYKLLSDSDFKKINAFKCAYKFKRKIKAFLFTLFPKVFMEQFGKKYL